MVTMASYVILGCYGCNRTEANSFESILLDDINQFVSRFKYLGHEEIVSKSARELDIILDSRGFDLIELKIINSQNREAIVSIPSGRNKLQFNSAMDSGVNGNVEWRESLYTGSEGEFKVFEVKSHFKSGADSFEIYFIVNHSKKP